MRRRISVLINTSFFYLLLAFSRLPLFILYSLSKILFVALYYVVGYRRKIVQRNLKGSLQRNADIKIIEKQFYIFLSEMFVETIKCLTISREKLLEMIRCENPELLDNYADKNKSVIIMSGHYGNWELLIYSMNLWIPHLAVGVGKKLSNQVLNNLTNDKRSKFGMEIIHAHNIKEEFTNLESKLTATLFISDQYPGGKNKGYFFPFLNKDTSFLYGAEKYAKKYNYPVLYADIQYKSRGRYTVKLIKITDNPQETPYGYIMERYVSCLTETINRAPQYWLWSHKRWKNIEGFYS